MHVGEKRPLAMSSLYIPSYLIPSPSTKFKHQCLEIDWDED